MSGSTVSKNYALPQLYHRIAFHYAHHTWTRGFPCFTYPGRRDASASKEGKTWHPTTHGPFGCDRYRRAYCHRRRAAMVDTSAEAASGKHPLDVYGASEYCNDCRVVP